MLKHFAALAFLATSFALPAMAQNKTSIASVKAGKSCAGCNLFQADLAYTDGQKMNLSSTRLRQSNLMLATYDDVNFSGATLSVSNLFGARFNRCDFRKADLRNATAVGTYFGSSNLSGANLSGANFSGANLSIARGLTQSQLNLACGDQSTKLPAGMTIPRCR